ncbi:energy transducer TonB [Pedobacter gandavensis]|uniref:energy transducer TonB n=1 Tax=Pedobacter gandavensis TaxID=2679963 RepID=UPI002931D062|nr:energy transducer TonB [Pedobacter gandavensis]
MYRILLLCFLLPGFSAVSQPRLKGGLESFVMKNKVYPPYSLQHCIEGVVNIEFKLNDQGKVFYSAVRSGVGTDLDQEALRLIRLSSGHWEVPKGHDSTVVLLAPLVFELSGYGCEGKTKAEINLAIANYVSNTGLTEVITNFYKNKGTANYKPEDEARFSRLKEELGYDEAYFAERVKIGKRKLKQQDLQGACEDFMFVKNMGSSQADELIARYCK